MQHPDIIGVSTRDEEFLNLFSNGFQQYIEGDWKKAKSILRSCEVRPKTGAARVALRTRGCTCGQRLTCRWSCGALCVQMRRKTRSGQLIADGPSQTLLRVMEAYDFQAPDGWECVALTHMQTFAPTPATYQPRSFCPLLSVHGTPLH
jgi:hypothetical protein